jgi:hypothetical protein
MVPLLPLALFLTTQLVAAIWWASRVTTTLEGIKGDVEQTHMDVQRLTERVTKHGEDIAAIRAKMG